MLGLILDQLIQHAWYAQGASSALAIREAIRLLSALGLVAGTSQVKVTDLICVDKALHYKLTFKCLQLLVGILAPTIWLTTNNYILSIYLRALTCSPHAHTSIHQIDLQVGVIYESKKVVLTTYGPYSSYIWSQGRPIGNWLQ